MQSRQIPAFECPVTALSDTFRLSNAQLEDIFRRARPDSPATWLPDIGYWAVTRYDDIRRVLSDRECFSSEITLQPHCDEIQFEARENSGWSGTESPA